MQAIVTGAAGFIGSHLCTYLLDRGDEVIGIDCLTDHYDPRRKEANLATLTDRDGFTEQRIDLTNAALSALFRRADVVYHLAGQEGLRGSWGEPFLTYVSRNITATQRVLEAACEAPLWKLVFASSSSVYGAAEVYPTPEHVCPRPTSPHAVTKLAAERLCEVYRTTSDVPTVCLRLFSVYGPRQRPDMAFSRLVDSALRNEPFLLYGDGQQSRDFTYVEDVVKAMRQAALSPWTGIANIGGGSPSTMNEVIETLEDIAGPFDVVHLPAQRGDLRHSAADTTRAREGFGYAPRVSLREGLERMVASRRDVFAADAPLPLGGPGAGVGMSGSVDTGGFA